MAAEALPVGFVSAAYAPLRYVTQQLETLDLLTARGTNFLASQLHLSKVWFECAEEDQINHRPTEGPVLVHKLKTQITTLLTASTSSVGAHYTSIVLIDTLVKVGGWIILQEIGPWIRGLVAIFRKKDVLVSKLLAIRLLTRIFLLANPHPTLVRESVTPVLPNFVTVCLELVKNGSVNDRRDCLAVVIPAFHVLVPRYPTSFRPFCTQIKTAILPLMVQTSSDITLPDGTLIVSGRLFCFARALFVNLCHTAPKNAASAEWEKYTSEIATCLHHTAKLVFRALIDDQQSFPRYHSFDARLNLNETVQDAETRQPGFPPWVGITAGVERLESLLMILGHFFLLPVSYPVPFKIGGLLEITKRIFSAMLPLPDHPVQTRPEISRDERDGLFNGIPRLHTAVFLLCGTIIHRVDNDAAATATTLLHQISWSFISSRPTDSVRKAGYEFLTDVIQLYGPNIPRPCPPWILKCIHFACEDLLPLPPSRPRATAPPPHHPNTSNRRNNNTAPIDTAPYLGHTQAQPIRFSSSIPCRLAASSLLSTLLLNLPPTFLPPHYRTSIDRTAILTSNKDILLASSTCPPPPTQNGTPPPTLLPFLARAFPTLPETESLLRPRLPPIRLPAPPTLYLEPPDFRGPVTLAPASPPPRTTPSPPRRRTHADTVTVSDSLSPSDSEPMSTQPLAKRLRRDSPAPTSAPAVPLGGDEREESSPEVAIAAARALETMRGGSGEGREGDTEEEKGGGGDGVGEGEGEEEEEFSAPSVEMSDFDDEDNGDYMETEGGDGERGEIGLAWECGGLEGGGKGVGAGLWQDRGKRGGR